MTITVVQYFGAKAHPAEHLANAVALLAKVNALLDEAAASGLKIANDPDTGSQISGSKGGAGDGGYRLSDSATGKPGSKHKLGCAVDVYDVGDRLDGWITRDRLVKHGLYREAGKFTTNWCHLQTIAPKSGNRSFIP